MAQLVRLVVLKWGQFCPQGDIWQCLVVTTGRGTLLASSGIEAREAANHNLMHKAIHTRKNYLVLKVNNAKIERPWVRWWRQGHRLKPVLATWSDSITLLRRLVNIIATELSTKPSLVKEKQPSLCSKCHTSVTCIYDSQHVSVYRVWLFKDTNNKTKYIKHQEDESQFYSHPIIASPLFTWGK